jgi:hypothetical protein
MPGKKDHISIKVIGVKIHEQKKIVVVQFESVTLSVLKIHIQESK